MGRFGLLGEKLSHSFSPFIHNLLGSYEYKLYEKQPDELDEFFHNANFDGLNVTIPYKKEVIKYCQSLSEAARITGNVNTITRQPDDTFHGDNTDLFGFNYLLKKAGVNISGAKAIILGSGGSSLTVQAVLHNADNMKAKEIIVISRTGNNNYENISKHYDAEIIINTTPVGMYPSNGNSPLGDLKMFKNCRAVVDLIYNPAKTEFLMRAEDLGIPCANGLAMLVAQAKKAAEHFTNAGIDDEKTEEIISKIIKKTRNIILIGMPGCGKTSIGQALANKTGREFADTDDRITRTSGKSIPAIFAEDGEEAFRNMETDALKSLCKQSGLIIATGGGIVTRPENQRLIRQNGIVIYLNRDVSQLPVSGRPLSEREGANKLAAVRLPLYEKWRDLKIKVSGIGIEQAAEEICNKLF